MGSGTGAQGLTTAARGAAMGRHRMRGSSGACRTSGESGTFHTDGFGETVGCARARSSGTRVPVSACSGCLPLRFPTDVCELLSMMGGRFSDDLVKETI